MSRPQAFPVFAGRRPEQPLVLAAELGGTLAYHPGLGRVVRKNSIRLPCDRDVGTYLFGLRDLEKREAGSAGRKYPSA
jgi:hypothetical protein